MNISRILTTTLAAAFTLPALADIPASRVPAPVKEQVQKQYPNAGAIEWDFDNDEDVYEAEFHLNGLEYDVKLYPDGTVCLIKADMRLQDLPAPVTAAIARDFPGYAPRPRQADHRQGSPEVPGGLPVRNRRRPQTGALLCPGRQTSFPEGGRLNAPFFRMFPYDRSRGNLSRRLTRRPLESTKPYDIRSNLQ